MKKQQFFLKAAIELASEFIRNGKISNAKEFERNEVGEKAAASAALLMSAVEAHWTEDLEMEEPLFDVEEEGTTEPTEPADTTEPTEPAEPTDTTEPTEPAGEGGGSGEG